MKQIVIAFATALTLCVGGMQAQTKTEIDQSAARMENPSTPCNKGGEPFKQFIAKFSSDADFMQSRLKLSEAQATEFKDLLVPSNFRAMGPVARNDDEWYQMWDELQFNTTYLSCGWVDSFVEHVYEFKRIGDKWYLAKIVVDSQ